MKFDKRRYWTFVQHREVVEMAIGFTALTVHSLLCRSRLLDMLNLRATSNLISDAGQTSQNRNSIFVNSLELQLLDEHDYRFRAIGLRLDNADPTEGFLVDGWNSVYWTLVQ